MCRALNRIFVVFFVLLFGCSSSPSVRETSSEVTDLKPTVLLVSFDGFRFDYLEKYPTPNLHRLMETGTTARLVPIFPSVTFPNHYTIVTGLYAEHHGIVGNEIYDPRNGHHFEITKPWIAEESEWWGGEPLWVTAEKQGQHSATMYWVGSTSEIKGVRPGYWKKYQADFPPKARVKQILEWLELPVDKRPTFLTLYFEQVDHAGHTFGPGSEQVGKAVAQLDEITGELVAGLEEKGIAQKIELVFVSDHGMADVKPDGSIPLGGFIDTHSVRIVGGGAYAEIFSQDENTQAVYQALKKAHPHLHVYLKNEIPVRFHYRDNPRIAPILCTADEGWYITKEKAKRAPIVGAHGYDPALPDMQGIFIAHGPAFRRGFQNPPLENIHIYNLVTHLLSLKPAPNDGSLESINSILVKKVTLAW